MGTKTRQLVKINHKDPLFKRNIRHGGIVVDKHELNYLQYPGEPLYRFDQRLRSFFSLSTVFVATFFSVFSAIRRVLLDGFSWDGEGCSHGVVVEKLDQLWPVSKDERLFDMWVREALEHRHRYCLSYLAVRYR